VSGCVVCRGAGLRPPLGLPSYATAGVPDDSDASVVIAAMIPHGLATDFRAPQAVLLADALDVDKEGFLVLRVE
jgi:hypothetical protein